ncbi:NAD(P)/FAD-dependent oxidoreductase [Phytohabitans flavus]|uniref:NAD(P)/FAD-dependent oxidoreductase n=1 Tax=Phytohabitans flavus TaxID=1076124 RepID=UPI00362F1E96
MRLTASVAVVGGGVVGSAAALFLAERGEDVVVLERASGPTQASVRNAGGLRAQCRNRTERRLALASIALWRDLAARTGIDIEYRQGGNLRVALAEPTLDALAAQGVEEAEDGLATEIWDRAALRRRAPHLSARFAGAKYCATDGHANPILATWMVVNAAKAAGVRYLTGADATHLDVDGGRVRGLRATAGGEVLHVEAPTVVHAAGPWTAALAATIGVELPLTPARNAMLVSERVPPLLAEFVSSHELKVYLRQARAGQVHVGGVFTVDGTFDQRVTHAEIAHLARAVEILPELGRMRILRTWAGTLDLTPDHLPCSVHRPEWTATLSRPASAATASASARPSAARSPSWSLASRPRST